MEGKREGEREGEREGGKVRKCNEHMSLHTILALIKSVLIYQFQLCNRPNPYSRAPALEWLMCVFKLHVIAGADRPACIASLLPAARIASSLAC